MFPFSCKQGHNWPSLWLLAIIFVATLLMGCRPNAADPDLTPEEQFSEVIENYPTVANYLVRSDIAFELLENAGISQLADSILITGINPALEESLRENARLNRCEGTILRNCFTIVCTDPEEVCDFNCENEQDIAQAACQVREAWCRARTGTECRLVPLD